jgi:hypothetical protein
LTLPGGGYYATPELGEGSTRFVTLVGERATVARRATEVNRAVKAPRIKAQVGFVLGDL